MTEITFKSKLTASFYGIPQFLKRFLASFFWQTSDEIPKHQGSSSMVLKTKIIVMFYRAIMACAIYKNAGISVIS
jgi:hypothetical protein